jgi:gamma-glutamylputrescine oxidase
MRYQNHRYTSLLELGNDLCAPLQDHITTDYLVIGGGVAGLHAAKYLIEQWHQVTLIEKNICGWGMSWRSGGFLTPDSELGLRQIEAIYGKHVARKLRDYGEAWQQLIVHSVQKHKLRCDLRQDDSLLLWLGKSWLEEVHSEEQIRKQYGLDAEFINRKKLLTKNTAHCYSGGVRYTNCYAINPAQYCQELKTYLITQWVRIYEFSEIKKIESHKVTTNLGSITFNKSIWCLGKTDRSLDAKKAANTYGIMNYITISEPLSSQQIHDIMPLGNCMCRDTQMVFNYYRITGDNRLILGGGDAFNSFQPFDLYQDLTIQSVIKQIRDAFPSLRDVHFDTYRSGRIEATKDLMPMIWRDTTFTNHRWVQWCVWLPWAAASGRHAAQQLLGELTDPDLDAVFSPHRPFLIWLQTNNLILKPIIFGLSNAKVMFG